MYDFKEQSTETTKVVTVEPGVIVEVEYGDRYEVESLVYVQPDGSDFFRYSHANGRYVTRRLRSPDTRRIPDSESFEFALKPSWAS